MTSDTFPSTTAFVFVPGGFCPGAFFEKVTDNLRSQGYTVAAIDLPSHDHTRAAGPAGHFDNADHIRTTIKSMKGKKVILCGNSYGGFVSNEALKDAHDAHAAQATGEGYVSHYVLLGSMLAPEGMNCHQLVMENTAAGKMQDGPDKPNFDVPEYVDGMLPATILCPSLPAEEIERYGAMITKQSSRSFMEKLTYAGWKYVPTTVVVPTRDAAIYPDMQRAHFAETTKDGQYPNVKMIEIDSDHCAMMSDPEKVIEILLNCSA
jgi:pimeloyl-ACP methyl ester carboxylesterase